MLGSMQAPAQTNQQDANENGAWKKHLRPGGETWTYTFHVGGSVAPRDPVASPSDKAVTGSDSGQGVVPQAAAAANPFATRPVASTTSIAAPSSAAESSMRPQVTTSFDIAVSRTYLMTAISGGVQAEPLVAGQQVYAFADWSLTGSTVGLTVDIRVLFDGTAICGGAASGQYANGHYTEYCSTGIYATPGTHTIVWDFNYDHLLPETDYSNNSMTLTFVPSAGPVDLIAQRALLRTAPQNSGIEVASPNVGDSVFFHLNWFVYGAITPLSVDLRATLDGVTYCSFNTGNNLVAAGPWVSWCPQAWTVTPGTHTLQWDLDYNNVITETDKRNNSATLAITAGAGDGTSPDSGWWWDPNLAGTGFFIEHGGKSGSGMFIGAFLYDIGGTATWLVSTGPLVGNIYTGNWLRVTGGPTLTGGYQAPTPPVNVGSLSITFKDSTHAVMTRPNGTQINIQRFSFGSNPLPAPPQPGTSQVGWWWAGPDQSGTGVGIEFQGTGAFMVAYVYNANGDPVWYLANNLMTTPNFYSGTWDLYGFGPMLTSIEGPYPFRKLGPAATMTLSFTDATHAVMTVNGVSTNLTRFQEF